ncbi:MAG: WG repeat-containing protein [Pyrinomonadaceae bacterium]
MSCAVNSESQDEILFPVRENGKMGFADKTGKFVIPAQYKFGFNFNGGLAFVATEDERIYFVDKTGKVIIELKNYSK